MIKTKLQNAVSGPFFCLFNAQMSCMAPEHGTSAPRMNPTSTMSSKLMKGGSFLERGDHALGCMTVQQFGGERHL
jgi:hypothetical protein